ncbi:MAG: thioredoxin domain-containing protein [Candidatus Yanofskybacteria bacterium]|nr:thioredoxin domain-containing protein [Candidatus Yanofskybacteria bacterium]
MNYKNKQLLSRILFLGLFALIIVGIFWMGRSLPTAQDGVSVEATAADFLPTGNGKAVLVEFSDFQCPACRAYYPLVAELRKEFSANLTVVYKNFPLKNIHKNAELASRAGEAAKLQGKFNEIEEILFAKQDEWANSGQALSLFRSYAEDLGLDMERFALDIDSSSVKDKVNADYQEGISLGVSGTPTFFLNGKKITNPRSYDEFKSIIEQSIK